MDFKALFNVPPPAGFTKTLRYMRLTAMLIMAACLQVSARGYSQKITLAEKDVPVEKVLQAIRAQTGYDFFYNLKTLELAGKVTIKVRDASVAETLDACFANTPLTYTITDMIIVINQRAVAVPEVVQPSTPTSTTPPPPGDIHGRVTDSLGNPLVGASVIVKGQRHGTQTDADGAFVLKGVDNNATLLISFAGFESREIRLNGRGEISLQLKQGIASLQDVVINKGYYTTSQKLNTGNVTKVSSKEIGEQPVANPLAALEGRVPGMVITQNTGTPNGSFTVQIRGQNSIANGNDPFFVIDGVPYIGSYLPNTSLNNVGRQGSPLNFINPADIESIEVLKDADATAIYGSRGANGVVLITTKKGKGGSMKVDLNAYTGFGKVTRRADLLNTPQFLEMRREAFRNDKVTPTVTNAPDLLIWDTTRYTDWQKVLIGGAAQYSDIQGSVSGGNATTQYLIGGSYHRETAVFAGSNADRKASVHFNITNSNRNQRLKIQLSGNYMADNNNMPNTDFASIAYKLAPDAPPLYNADGSLNWAPITQGSTGTWTNPLGLTRQRYKARTSSLVAHAMLSYTILRGLEFRTSLGYTDIQANEVSIIPLTSYDPASASLGVTGNSSFANSFINTSIIEPQLNYKLHLGKGTLSALLGSTLQHNSYTGQELFATGFSSDAFLQYIQAASSVTIGNSTNTQYKYNAFFGQLNYNWEDKYILNLTARRDGSSRFGPGKQFASFGAAGAAWIFSQEKFIREQLPFLSFGKIRGSYGTTGNDQVGDYRYLDLYTNTYYPYQNTQGLVPANLFNPDLAWELTKKLEGGIELGFFKDRININASWFQNRSSNQLIGYQLSDVTGFYSIDENLPATVQNTGLELVLSITNVKSRNFTWSSAFNLTLPHNKLISFPGLANSSYSNSYIVGQPLTVSRRYHLIGVDPQTGRFQFSDSKGNPTFTPSAATDRTVIADFGKNRYYGGFQNGFRYKGLSLDIFFQFVHQKATPYLNNTLAGFKSQNQPTSVLDRWQGPGDNASLPRYSQNTGGPIYPSLSLFAGSDKYWVDGSFIRLKNLSFSYSLPDKWLQKKGIQNFRVYIQGQNLWTSTRYKGVDPENSNFTAVAIAPLRVWTGGFQITF